MSVCAKKNRAFILDYHIRTRISARTDETYTRFLSVTPSLILT